MNREERIYSVTMTEDELRLFSEFLNCCYEKVYSEEEKEIRLNDRLNIALDKGLLTKREREAVIEAYDKDIQKGHKMSAHVAKRAAIGTGIAGAALAAATKDPRVLGGAAVASGITAGGAYIGGRIGHAMNKPLRNASSDYDFRLQKTADRAKVANGDMTREEFAKIYGKDKKKKK